jgi:hypothetical protein
METRINGLKHSNIKIGATIIFGMIRFMAIADADPLHGMRGVTTITQSPDGISHFVVGENSNWETRSFSGTLLASGTYSARGARKICFSAQAGVLAAAKMDCMEYTGDQNRGLIYSALGRRGQVVRFVFAKKSN